MHRWYRKFIKIWEFSISLTHIQQFIYHLKSLSRMLKVSRKLSKFRMRSKIDLEKNFTIVGNLLQFASDSEYLEIWFSSPISYVNYETSRNFCSLEQRSKNCEILKMTLSFLMKSWWIITLFFDFCTHISDCSLKVQTHERYLFNTIIFAYFGWGGALHSGVPRPDYEDIKKNCTGDWNKFIILGKSILTLFRCLLKDPYLMSVA